MERENENQDQEQPVIIGETAAECIQRLKSELAEAKQTSESRRLALSKLSEQIDDIEEEALSAFCRIPYLMQWVENIVEDSLNLKLKHYMDSDDIERAIDERLEMDKEDSDFVSHRGIEDMIEFAIDEAKEESQEIAKEKIQEMIDDTLNNATFDTSIIL